MTLVSVPWQPGFKVIPQLLTRLQRASEIAGHYIWLTDAWRSYAEQKYYWDAYMAGWGNPASNPDDPNGQNNHRRGAAVDIASRADRAAMLAAGFIPDGVEWWHFNEPGSWPIINTDTSPAATNVKTLEEELEEMLRYEYFSIVGDTVPGQQYISLNRFGYIALSGQDKKDYDYYIHDILGQPIPGVQSVKNPTAFGPRLR